MEKIKSLAKNRGSTVLIRIALLGIAAIVVFFGSFMVSGVYTSWAEESPELAGWKYPIMLVIICLVVTFFVAVSQIWRLLGLIDKNRAFTQASVNTMRNVKYCGFTMSGILAVLLPLVIHAAQNDDAPGLILLYGTIFVGVPFVVAVLAGVAQKLFQNAIDIKKENDLTV